MGTEAKAASPDDLLKAAVAGTVAPGTAGRRMGVGALRVPAWLRRNARLCGTAGAALVLGAAVGAGAMTVTPKRGRAPDALLVKIKAGIEADRKQTARLSTEIAGLQQALTDLRAIAEAGRKEAAARGGAITERIAQLDRGVATKVAALGERIDQAEREQAARVASLAAQPERRPPPAVRPEPVQTGSLAEPKPAEARPAETRTAETKPVAKAKPAADDKPPVIDGWAVRDVYDGVAIVENRHRRLAQVVPGDVLPGVGRVEAVERQGRGWVVVTRQGIVTPQPW